jgi:TolA-binding protein
MKLNALSQYWLAEISYLRKNYSTAIEGWKKFQEIQGATSLDEYDLSNYALGYAYFQRKEKEDYTNANISFRKFLLSKNKYDLKKIADANIRTADSYFMNRDFARASDYYETAIAMNLLDIDYSLFQMALCDGLSKKYDDKIIALKKIESSYPHSNYLSASMNEIADTYYNNLRQEDNAIVYYEKILKNYPNSSFTNNCYAQLGNIYYGRKEDDKAFYYYDLFVKSDSKSEAAKEILQAIKKIFEAKGNVNEMTSYFASVGSPLSGEQIEKATYQAAYDAYYTAKNCDEAMPKWEAYIQKFPNGKYINEAYFNDAECAYSKSLFPKALEGYQYVISKPRGIYTEVALNKTTYLLFQDKKYIEALPLFQQLQEFAETPINISAGKFGAMRCAFYLNKFDVALNESNKVLNIEKLSPQQASEAKYIKAKSLYETNRIDDALIEFKAMTKNSKNSTGAEAYYYIAKIMFAKQEYKEVEKTVTKLIGYEYSNDDWNNKGMLLLADAYMAKGEDADAQVILETIINGNVKPEYVDEATKKLALIMAKLEQQQMENAAQPSEQMKVRFNQTKSDSTLFKPELEIKTTPTSTITEQPK